MELPSLLTLDVASVEQAESVLAARLLEFAPAIDQRGAVGRLALRIHAALLAAESAQMEQLRTSSTLQAALANPTELDEATVDALLSNYRLERGEALSSSGSVTIAVSAKENLTIVAGARFVAGGQTFAASDTYQIKTDDADVTAATDRGYRLLGTGLYGFTIDVEAVTAGAAGNLPQGVRVTPLTRPANFVLAYTESELSGGADAADAQALLRQARAGLAARGLASAVAVESIVRSVPEMVDMTAVSVIRSDDPEQRRHNALLPIAQAGRVDVYVKSQPLWAASVTSKTATLVEKRDDGSVWQATFTRDEAEGLLEVSRIWSAARGDGSGYDLVSDTRGVDMSDVGDLAVADIATGVQAAFSAFQTVILKFLDTDVDASELAVNIATAEYQFELRMLSGIAEAQEALANRRSGAIAGDALAKTPVPCFVGLNFTIVKPSNFSPTPTLATLRTLLSDVVGATGFDGGLDASLLLSRVYPRLAVGQTIRDFDMYGRILCPDGSTRLLRDAQRLEVPDTPEDMVSRRTVAFFLSPDDVGIEVEVV